VTLKSGFEVIQGSKSLKMAPFKSLGTVSYSHFVAITAVSLAVCEIFSITEWRDLKNWVRDCSRSLCSYVIFCCLLA